MTEAEWAACRDPRELLDYHRMKTHPRRLRLLAVACVRAAVEPTPLVTRVLDVVERYADGAADRSEFLAARKAARSAVRDGTAPAALRQLADDAMEGVTVAMAGVRGLTGPDGGAVECGLIRCVFGNPYRAVPVDPAWRTSSVVGLARGIYDEYAFDRLPVLADALEDASCTDHDVLAHCRDTAPHARGCWVLDGLLGS